MCSVSFFYHSELHPSGNEEYAFDVKWGNFARIFFLSLPTPSDALASPHQSFKSLVIQKKTYLKFELTG